MQKILMSPDEAAVLIRSGRFLAIAADEEILGHLPAGNWIGGTIPYFVGEQGGVQSRALVHVTDLAGPHCGAKVMDYTTTSMGRIALEAPERGYTLLIIPALSALHGEYAAKASDYEDMYMKPIVGWIAGVHLDDLGKVSPKVINGRTGQLSDSHAVAIHLPLPASQTAVIRILNLFHQGKGDVITFPADGFEVSECKVNGQPANFAQYAKTHQLDPARPLVADYNGAQINVSFQNVDADHGKVQFYAPVFAGVEYRHAAPVGDYVEEFNALASGIQAKPAFACNCILNYLYGKLEGRKTGNLTGPVTFGEIGYQLLNQTLVYLEIIEAP